MANANQAILNKVRKLLSKTEGNGCTVEEAAAAAGAAQRLLSEHQLSMADVHSNVPEDDEVVQRFQPDIKVQRKLATWKGVLMQAIVTNNSCRFFYQWVDRGFAFRLIGREGDIEICQYMYAHLEREIEMLCKQHLAAGIGFGRRWANSFRMGASTEIARRLREARLAAESHASERALVVVGNRMQKVNAVYSKLGLRTRYANTSQRYDGSGWQAGRNAARNIAMSRALKGGRSVKQIGGK